MPPSQWRLQDAKTQLSQVVEAAMQGEPQHITRRGKRAVVVVSEEVFDAFKRNAQLAAPGFVAHLLAMPKAKEDIERLPVKLREVDLT
jgi:prevent-host-death family protein